MMSSVLLFSAVTLLVFCDVITAEYYGNYYCRPGRDVMVHLFEWKWTDVEKECAWLAQHNYCAVQVSPPSEHRVVTDPPYPWWQRYQPVSYKMGSRSGNETMFKNMVTTCNNLGVYIYVDGVINHMTGGGSGIGSDGNRFDGDRKLFPGVPYGPDDFNGGGECWTSSGNIENYNDANQVRNCMLVGLQDLKLSSEYVRDKVAEYLNKMIRWGVAGFRLDASKHMWPEDMAAILGRLENLNTRWFPAGTKPYIYQEVIDLGGEGIGARDYKHIGRVTEFRHCKHLGEVIRKNSGQKLSYFRNYGESWGQLNALDVVVFVDNHDNQRGHGAGGGNILTFFDPNMYKIANAFQLAWQYGHVRIMSSYNWPRNIVGDKDQNDWVGPPSTGGGVTKDVTCFNGEWICEHRWRQIFNMVAFHNVALGSVVSNWWDNGGDQIAFARTGRGFIVINNEWQTPLSRVLSTSLPPGQYCDVITCDNNRPPCGNQGGTCRDVIRVNTDGSARFRVQPGEDPMIAIHI